MNTIIEHKDQKNKEQQTTMSIIREQFDNLAMNEVDYDQEYDCGFENKATHLTTLMKYVLCNNYGFVKGSIDSRANDANLFRSKTEAKRELKEYINKVNSENQSALFLAICNDVNPMIISMLIDNGADVNATDKYDRSILWIAISRGNLVTAKYLLDNGANVNAVDKDGTSPLCVAVKNNIVEGVQLLLNYKADITIQDYFFKTVLMYAIEIKNITIVQMLSGALNQGLLSIMEDNDQNEMNDEKFEAMNTIISSGQYFGFSAGELFQILNIIKDNKYVPIIRTYILLHNSLQAQLNEQSTDKSKEFLENAIKYVINDYTGGCKSEIMEVLCNICSEKSIKI